MDRSSKIGCGLVCHCPAETMLADLMFPGTLNMPFHSGGLAALYSHLSGGDMQERFFFYLKARGKATDHQNGNRQHFQNKDQLSHAKVRFQSWRSSDLQSCRHPDPK
jgi:hypothetical protein